MRSRRSNQSKYIPDSYRDKEPDTSSESEEGRLKQFVVSDDEELSDSELSEKEQPTRPTSLDHEQGKQAVFVKLPRPMTDTELKRKGWKKVQGCRSHTQEKKKKECWEHPSIKCNKSKEPSHFTQPQTYGSRQGGGDVIPRCHHCNQTHKACGIGRSGDRFCLDREGKYQHRSAGSIIINSVEEDDDKSSDDENEQAESDEPQTYDHHQEIVSARRSSLRSRTSQSHPHQTARFPGPRRSARVSDASYTKKIMKETPVDTDSEDEPLASRFISRSELNPRPVSRQARRSGPRVHPEPRSPTPPLPRHATSSHLASDPQSGSDSDRPLSQRRTRKKQSLPSSRKRGKVVDPDSGSDDAFRPSQKRTRRVLDEASQDEDDDDSVGLAIVNTPSPTSSPSDTINGLPITIEAQDGKGIISNASPTTVDAFDSKAERSSPSNSLACELFEHHPPTPQFNMTLLDRLTPISLPQTPIAVNFPFPRTATSIDLETLLAPVRTALLETDASIASLESKVAATQKQVDLEKERAQITEKENERLGEIIKEKAAINRALEDTVLEANTVLAKKDNTMVGLHAELEAARCRLSANSTILPAEEVTLSTVSSHTALAHQVEELNELIQHRDGEIADLKRSLQDQSEMIQIIEKERDGALCGLGKLVLERDRLLKQCEDTQTSKGDTSKSDFALSPGKDEMSKLLDVEQVEHSQPTKDGSSSHHEEKKEEVVGRLTKHEVAAAAVQNARNKIAEARRRISDFSLNKEDPVKNEDARTDDETLRIVTSAGREEGTTLDTQVQDVVGEEIRKEEANTEAVIPIVRPKDVYTMGGMVVPL